MTHPPGEPTAIQACQNRTRLRQMVSNLLAGTGLEIRDRDKHLVICNPRHPEHGRIYVTYTAGEISLRQTTWQYWGYLDGYGQPEWADPDSEPAITASTIINTLSGQTSEAATTPGSITIPGRT